MAAFLTSSSLLSETDETELMSSESDSDSSSTAWRREKKKKRNGVKNCNGIDVDHVVGYRILRHYLQREKRALNERVTPMYRGMCKSIGPKRWRDLGGESDSRHVMTTARIFDIGNVGSAILLFFSTNFMATVCELLPPPLVISPAGPRSHLLAECGSCTGR